MLDLGAVRKNLSYDFCLLLLFGLFFTGVVSSQSETETQFNLGAGCTFDFGYEEDGSDKQQFSLFSGECSGGEIDGEVYCDEMKWLVTREPTFGCAMGNGDYELGDLFCCPPGMFCNDSSKQCETRLVNCFDQLNKDDCDDSGCIWLDVLGECADGVRDLGCGYYDNNKSCEEDEWNLGLSGIGTEFCGLSDIECAGKQFVVPKDSCSCEWNSVTGSCQLNLFVSEVRVLSEDAPDEFSCANTYSLGDCVDGLQSVTWSSISKIISGFSDNEIPEECLAAVGCNGGEKERFCGEPLVKLPVFGLLGFVVALGLVALVYYLRRDR